MSIFQRAGRWRSAPVLLFAQACLCAAFAPTPARAALILNDPLPIEHRVYVQLIRTGADSGDPMATDFGSADQRADIQNKVNQIWAQAGVQVVFQNNINNLYSTLAYNQANSLYEISAEALAAGVRSPDWTTLNLYLVGEVPRHGEHSLNSSAGVASVNANGIAQFVGANLLGTGYGRDLIASVTAHEIGHNLGLWHSTAGGNLMNDGAKLDATQIETVLSSAFLKPVTQIDGDFNKDGLVDVADYVVWRDGLGSIYTQADYSKWRNSYGAKSSAAASTLGTDAIPEPAAAALAAGFLLLFLASASRNPLCASPR